MEGILQVRIRGDVCDVRLPGNMSVLHPQEGHCSYSRRESITHKWKTTVCAHADLGLVCVDEDSGVSQWSSTSIARHYSVVCPSYRLLVDQVNGSLRSRLDRHQYMFVESHQSLGISPLQNQLRT